MCMPSFGLLNLQKLNKPTEMCYHLVLVCFIVTGKSSKTHIILCYFGLIVVRHILSETLSLCTVGFVCIKEKVFYWSSLDFSWFYK